MSIGLTQATESAAGPWAFSLDEVADRLGISKMSVRRAVARGELEAVKFGNLTRIMAEELRRYTEQAPRAEFRKPRTRPAHREHKVA